MMRSGPLRKERIIDGIKVLVNCQPNETGYIPENFYIRIKHPAGDIDLEMAACYYWQVFNEIRAMLPSLLKSK